MKTRLKQIADAMHKYNSDNMAYHAFGLCAEEQYDALVVAPSFTPYALHMDETCNVFTMREGSYIAGYQIEKGGLKIAWIKIGSSAGNLIDHLSLCTELSFRKLIFVGAVGGLKPGFSLGDVCVPSRSISGSYADAYLMKASIRETMQFDVVYPDARMTDEVMRIAAEKGFTIKQGSVFCTPSIALEYLHLDEIRQFDADLIEMETSSFFLMTDLFELPGAALLVVSDSSASVVPLVGKTDEQRQRYEYGKTVVLPELILALAGEND